MDFDLTDEQQLIRNTAREFTDNEIVERAKQNARNHHFDLDLVKKIADQGYLGRSCRVSTVVLASTTSATG